nr:Uncharacterised protein [Klebsiella pneumoniae]
MERPEGGPLAAPYVKVKLDAIASEQFTRRCSWRMP